MNEQPVALLLAEKLEQQFPVGTAQRYLDGEAAAELRRLHARDKEWESVTGFMQTTTDRMESELLRLHSVNAQLLEALEMGYADTMDYIKRNHLSGSENNHWLVAARAAIAAAKEMK